VTERCIVRVKFTLAGGDAAVRRAVGGFLRYVQHRDLHPTQPVHQQSSVSGLVKYVAYRDQASARAELFGWQGLQGTSGRKAFVDFVARSVADSQPQLFRTRDGRMLDRRRAISRLIISPERSHGLDLELLTRAAMDRLAEETGSSDLRWIAAIHRNTAHHHIHLVVAGMHQDVSGRFHRVDITKPRLAAIKEAVALEIERQRGERIPARLVRLRNDDAGATLSLRFQVARKPGIGTAKATFLRDARWPGSRPRQLSYDRVALLRLRAAAQHYRHQIEREAEEEIRRRHWELAA